MLPTFVIGLREGLEAALIVGIVAAFLAQSGRRDQLRRMWAGVLLAVSVCLAVGVGLHVLSADLPQRQQEGLETVIGVVAVTMVTSMIVWMRRHARDLKGQLEGAAGRAVASGSGTALVLTAFLAVFREGFETAVFLLAAFNGAARPAPAAGGAVVGLALAAVLGYGIYRGGVRLNLSRFFRATGLVLVAVSAGLVVSALHTAHEAGWLHLGQGRTVDLSALVQPGSVQASVLTGILGLQPHPVSVELVGWLLYLIPVGVYVAWPPGRPAPLRVLRRSGAVVAAGAAVLGVIAIALAPDRPAGHDPAALTLAVTGASPHAPSLPVARFQVLDRTGSTVRVAAPGDLGGTWTLTRSGTGRRDGRGVEAYVSTVRAPADPAGHPPRVTLSQLAVLNGGRLPLGVRADQEAATVPVRYERITDRSVWLDADTGSVVDVSVDERTTVTATLSSGATPLGVVSHLRTFADPASVAAAVDAARREMDAAHRRDLWRGIGVGSWVVAGLAATVAVVTSLRLRRSRPSAAFGPSIGRARLPVAASPPRP